jgi:serine/threonine protein phosphatase PrpC
MASMMMNSIYKVEIETAVRQLCKGQDYVEKGHGVDSDSGEEFDWALLNDGHGSHSCIRFIRDIPIEKKAELIGTGNPVEALAEYIDTSGCVRKDESSGATVVIVKFYSDRAVCLSSGDSQVAVFKNGELEYLSKEHNCHNPEEVDRVKAMGFSISTQPNTNSKMVAKNQLAVADSVYAVFPGEEDDGSGTRVRPEVACRTPLSEQPFRPVVQMMSARARRSAGAIPRPPATSAVARKSSAARSPSPG